MLVNYGSIDDERMCNFQSFEVGIERVAEEYGSCVDEV